MIHKTTSNNRYILLGLSLIILGIILPSDFNANLSQASVGLTSVLINGGLLFKAGLVMLGLWIVILKRLTGYLNGRDREESKTTLDRNTILALSLLMIVTVFIRFYALNSGLWLDEILTYVGYATRPFIEIVTTFDSENQHFLYSLLAHTSFLIFGESSWALRLPAALFGIGSILALFFFGLEITNKQEAFFAAALLSLSYHHIWFSQNARGYSGLLFWTILSSLYLLRGFRENRAIDWLYYGIAASLGTYTHLTMGFVILGQGLSVGLAALFEAHKIRFRKIIGILTGFGTAAILSFVLYSIVLPQMASTIGGSESSVVNEWKTPIWTVMELLRGLSIGFTGWFMGAIVLFVAGSGLLSYLRRNPIFIGISIIPPIVGAAITILVGHHLWPRFFFFAFGFGALIVIRGIMVVGKWFGDLSWVPIKLGSKIGQLGSIGLILLSSASFPFAYGPKQDYLGALDYIQQNRAENDAVVTVSLAAFPYSNLYLTDWQPVNSIEELSVIENQADLIWLVYTFPPVLESVSPDLMKIIENDFSVVKIFKGSVAGGDIIVCKSIRASSLIQPLDSGW
jgi:mannosyltransferase